MSGEGRRARRSGFAIFAGVVFAFSLGMVVIAFWLGTRPLTYAYGIGLVLTLAMFATILPLGNYGTEEMDRWEQRYRRAIEDLEYHGRRTTEIPGSARHRVEER